MRFAREPSSVYDGTMSEAEALQLKKDALWEVHQASRRVACLKRKISVLLRNAAKAATGWEDGRLRVNDDNLIANYPDGSLDSGIEFGSSDVLKAAIRDLVDAENGLASARREFDDLR